ncbi:MAG: hypothetical protein HOG49_33490 [Candidatus Scalindua sp.]|jgi:hypothetical protein|nr:hypothetical protein [Candidatus Scalindua sp.]
MSTIVTTVDTVLPTPREKIFIQGRYYLGIHSDIVVVVRCANTSNKELLGMCIHYSYGEELGGTVYTNGLITNVWDHTTFVEFFGTVTITQVP